MNPYTRENRPAYLPSWRYRLKRDLREFLDELPWAAAYVAVILAASVVVLELFWWRIFP